MRILITNDDGIESEGLRVLAVHLAETEHDLVVVAPDRNYSGSGAALGDLQPDALLEVSQVQLDDLPGVDAWALAGAPALCVVAANLGAFGPPPELVVSGINAGLNTGRSILHSGTVGAALTAQNFGTSGLAVSVDRSDPWRWDTAATLAVEMLDRVIDGPERSVLNLNVPAVSRDQVEGVRWTSLAPFGAVRATMSTRSDTQVQFELTPSDYHPDEDTDQGAVEAGWASLSTLVGIAEAWPPDADQPEHSPELELRIAPGASLHPVHQIPDASGPHWLRRPRTGSAQ